MSQMQLTLDFDQTSNLFCIASLYQLLETQESDMSNIDVEQVCNSLIYLLDQAGVLLERRPLNGVESEARQDIKNELNQLLEIIDHKNNLTAVSIPINA